MIPVELLKMRKGDQKDIEDEIMNLEVESNNLHERNKELSSKLESIGSNRTVAFLTFLDTLKKEVHRVYAKLTESRGDQGSFKIIVENSELPFESQIHLIPEPPLKRFTFGI